MKRVMFAAALAALQCGAVFAGARTSEAAQRIAIATSAGAPCSAYAGHFEQLDAAGTRYAIGVFTHDGTHAVSGVVALYHGDDRYDVRFANATAADPRDEATVATPLVVRFDAPADVDAAVVTTLDGASCAPMNEPVRAKSAVTPRIGSTIVGATRHPQFGAPPSNPGEAWWQRFRAAAADAPALVPGPVVREPHVACERPDRPATTSYVTSGYGMLDANAVFRGVGGQAYVLLTLDDGDTVVKSRIERSSGAPEVDAASTAIVAASRFRSPVFHCRAYGGSYLFATDLR